MKIKHCLQRCNELSYFIKLNWPHLMRRIDVGRALNILKSLYEFRMRKIRCESAPFVFRIDVSAICNLKCVECQTHRRKFLPGEVKLMSHGDFVNIFDQIKNSALKISYFMNGEPLMNKDLASMISIASGNKIFTAFSTNFNLATDKIIEDIVNSNLDYIRICLDGFSQEAYGSYRVNGNVQKVKSGIEKLMEYRRARGSSFPFVSIQTILFDHVVPEVNKIKRFCSEKAVDELFMCSDLSSFTKDSLKFGKLPSRKCFYPWISMSVDADGKVFPCCVNQSQSFGNILHSSLDSIWNNKYYRSTRRLLNDGFSNEIYEEFPDLPCFNCNMYYLDKIKK